MYQTYDFAFSSDSWLFGDFDQVVFYSVIVYSEITESQSLAKSYMLTPFSPYGEEGMVMVFANSEWL